MESLEPENVAALKNLASSCLYKRIISKWEKGLSPEFPLAIVAWEHIFYLKNASNLETREAAVKFIREFGNKGSNNEATCWGNGGFDHGLLENSSVVSNVFDSELCPDLFVEDRSLMSAAGTAEWSFGILIAAAVSAIVFI